MTIVRRDLGLPSRREWRERLATREPVEGGGIAEEIHAARAERDAQIDAALGWETEPGRPSRTCGLVTGDRRLSRAPGLGVPLVTV